jgi:proteasome accessory factor A
MGQETEYALRCSPIEASPGNDVLFDRLAAQIEQLVPSAPGSRRLSRRQRFLANGGSVYYEFLPQAMQAGLIEAGTPECRGPSALLLYQKAQDDLLCQAADRISTPDREIGLLKNCRDGNGNTYGAQENYEAIIATGGALWGLRIGTACLIPLLVCLLPIVWGTMLALVLLALGTLLALALIDSLVSALFKRSLLGGLLTEESRLLSALGWVDLGLQMVLLAPVLVPYAVLLRGFAFRPQRAALTPFLMSRPIVAGAGTLVDDRFMLSEKGPAMRRLMRLTIRAGDRPVFDTGNLMKRLMGPLLLRPRDLFKLFEVRQRLQLGLADANRCQVAEFLKLGTTALVIDMAEAGRLDDAPRLIDPLGALRSFIGDPNLEATAFDVDGTAWTALMLQRFYLERAREFIAEAPAASMEAHDVLRLWGEALDALEAEPGGLIGRLDWVTKRYLLRAAGTDVNADARKKIDLRYHELGDGYLSWLEAEGLAPRLVTPEEAEAAIQTPPANSPAALRGRLIRQLADEGLPAVASWDQVRTTDAEGRRKVVSLADWRKARNR